MAAKKPARLNLRLSPQLLDGLRAAAAEAGCSLNAFAVQVLAAAAGHAARFRGIAGAQATPEEQRVDRRDIPRDYRGYPVTPTARFEHIGARDAFIQAMEKEMPFSDVMKMVAELDENDPGHYVDWKQARSA